MFVVNFHFILSIRYLNVIFYNFSLIKQLKCDFSIVCSCVISRRIKQTGKFVTMLQLQEAHIICVLKFLIFLRFPDKHFVFPENVSYSIMFVN